MATKGVTGMVRASLTLILGGAVAQVLPLMLGPLLTRMYSPDQLGMYHLFAAVAANLGVVACGRYEFAIPLATAEDDAHVLRALCVRILWCSVPASMIGALAWWLLGGESWVLWLPLGVTSAGAVSVASMWAMRAQHFSALAVSRVWRYGGAAAAQVVAGWAGCGITGLILAPIASTMVATLWLRMPWGLWTDGGKVRELARRHKDFPLLNTPHAFAGALQDTLAVALVASLAGPAAAGFWGLGLRYLKAPATLIGGAVSQALYPKLTLAGIADPYPTRVARQAVRRVILTLTLLALPLSLGLLVLAPWAFQTLFGPTWRPAGDLARALSAYIGVHFVAAPLGVVTMAWHAQSWALKVALVGQVAFVLALWIGLKLGGLTGAGWAVSAVMVLYFAYYLIKLVRWPVVEDQRH